MNKKDYIKLGYICPKLSKNETIRNWKKYGLVDNYDLIYDRLVKSKNCEICLTKYKLRIDGALNRVMEHCHISGYCRSICCTSCNNKNEGIWVI